MNLNDFCKVEKIETKEENEWNLPTSENPKVVMSKRRVKIESSNEKFEVDDVGVPYICKNSDCPQFNKLWFDNTIRTKCKFCGKKSLR